MSHPTVCEQFPALRTGPVEEKEIVGSLAGRKVDFALPQDWKERAARITLIVLQILILPWGIVEGLRYLLGRVVMAALYPASSDLIKRYAPHYRAENLDVVRLETFESLAENGYAVKHVVLEKRGVRYSGLLVGHEETLNNGSWVLQADGNGMTAEHNVGYHAEFYRKQGKNLLMVNGPSVGRSEGTAYPETMGDAQDVGLTFLEEVIKADKIQLTGFSLGGASIGQAILQHKFDTSKHTYTVQRLMTFDTVSNMIYSFVEEKTKRCWLASMAAGLVHFCGLEMDSVAASRKLQDLSIEETVVQSCNSKNQVQHDGVIPSIAALAHALLKSGVTAGKTFVGLNIGHSGLHHYA